MNRNNPLKRTLFMACATLFLVCCDGDTGREGRSRSEERSVTYLRVYPIRVGVVEARTNNPVPRAKVFLVDKSFEQLGYEPIGVFLGETNNRGTLEVRYPQRDIKPLMKRSRKPGAGSDQVLPVVGTLAVYADGYVPSFYDGGFSWERQTVYMDLEPIGYTLGSQHKIKRMSTPSNDQNAGGVTSEADLSDP
jgi:hypothetical protein